MAGMVMPVDDGKVRLVVELFPEELDVLTGYCKGTGQDRTKVVRRILRDWSEAKKHEATLILRFADGKETAPKSGCNRADIDELT